MDCGLGSATATFNCRQHKQAAKDQASDLDGARAKRQRPSEVAPEPVPSTQQAQKKKKGKKKNKEGKKHVEAEVQKAMTDVMGPYLQQMQALHQSIASIAVRPFSTGYIR